MNLKRLFIAMPAALFILGQLARQMPDRPSTKRALSPA